ncbi:MAG: hypothetical protein HY964_00540 [Ignavibacteriales bacterium]|nr:hypothetical protein [Ignavibacteriales bacterium]
MNQLLYGFNPDENILYVSSAGDHSMHIYKRIDNKINIEEHDFYPYFYLSNPQYFTGFTGRYWLKKLAGNNYFKYLVVFSSWIHLWEAINFCIQRYNQTSPIKINYYSELPFIHFTADPVTQFLKQSGKTLFKGINFSDLNRLQIDIKTQTSQKSKASNAYRLEDQILAIGLKNNSGFQKTLSILRKSEKDILQELIEIIKSTDPDIIEGYDLINYILPYLAIRCELFNIDFQICRDGSVPKFSGNRYYRQDKPGEYYTVEITGRHAVDIIHLYQFHFTKSSLSTNVSLKPILNTIGVEELRKEYLSPEITIQQWNTDSDTIINDCKSNLKDIDRISRMISPKLFQLTKMFPFNYGTLSRTNIASKIESLLLREYLRTKHSIPRAIEGMNISNSYDEVYYSGVFEPVSCLDIDHVYPRIMLEQNIFPRFDELNVCKMLLNYLCIEYFNNSDTVQEVGLTGSFNILISSFYPYIGNQRSLFNDLTAFDIITQKSKEVINNLISTIENGNGIPVLAEKDKIYFVFPPDKINQDSPIDLIKKMEIKSNIRNCLSIKNNYQKILILKKHNYILLTYNDKIVFTGSAITSKNSEPFGRIFIRDCIYFTFKNNFNKLHSIYVENRNKILTHRMPIKLLAKTEILRDSLDDYQIQVNSGKRNRYTAYDVAITSGKHFNKGDLISFYVQSSEHQEEMIYKSIEEWDSNFPDENVSYYLKRLDDFARRFETLFTEKDFQLIFSDEDLFGFSDSDIKLVSQKIIPDVLSQPDEEQEEFQIEPRIWLDEESN